MLTCRWTWRGVNATGCILALPPLRIEKATERRICPNPCSFTQENEEIEGTGYPLNGVFQTENPKQRCLPSFSLFSSMLILHGLGFIRQKSPLDPLLPHKCGVPVPVMCLTLFFKFANLS